MALTRKIGIIGCGNVGMTVAYTLMFHGLCAEMVLIDVNRQKAEKKRTVFISGACIKLKAIALF